MKTLLIAGATALLLTAPTAQAHTPYAQSEALYNSQMRGSFLAFGIASTAFGCEIRSVDWWSAVMLRINKRAKRVAAVIWAQRGYDSIAKAEAALMQAKFMQEFGQRIAALPRFNPGSAPACTAIRNNPTLAIIDKAIGRNR